MTITNFTANEECKADMTGTLHLNGRLLTNSQDRKQHAKLFVTTMLQQFQQLECHAHHQQYQGQQAAPFAHFRNSEAGSTSAGISSAQHRCTLSRSSNLCSLGASATGKVCDNLDDAPCRLCRLASRKLDAVLRYGNAIGSYSRYFPKASKIATIGKSAI